MRTSSRLAAAAAFAAALVSSAPAAAQFSNNSIGFEAGYFILDRSIGASDGPVLGVDSTLYLDSSFELYFRVLVGIHEDLAASQNAVGFFPALGIRYLFSEEDVRPYAGFDLAYLHFFGSETLPSALFSASPFAGLEIFVAADFAIGVQAEYHRILVFNGEGGNAFAGLAKVAWGF